MRHTVRGYACASSHRANSLYNLPSCVPCRRGHDTAAEQHGIFVVGRGRDSCSTRRGGGGACCRFQTTFAYVIVAMIRRGTGKLFKEKPSAGGGGKAGGGRFGTVVLVGRRRLVQETFAIVHIYTMGAESHGYTNVQAVTSNAPPVKEN